MIITRSQGNHPENYKVSVLLEGIPAQSKTRINRERLREAWNAAFRHHGLPRAVFIDTLPGISGAANVVLKRPGPDISICHVQLKTPQSVLDIMQNVQRDYLESKSFQWFPQESMYRETELTSEILINTAFTFQRLSDGAEASATANQITLRPIAGVDIREAISLRGSHG